MKSELFSRFDPNDESNSSFKKDLELLLSLEQSDVSKVINIIPDYLESEVSSRDKEILKDLRQDTNLTNNQIHRLIHFGTFISRMVNDPELEDDTPELWAEDLFELELLNEDQVENFISISNQIVENISNEVEDLSRTKEYQIGLIPRLKRIGTTIEIRAIQKDEFEIGNSIGSYQPSIVGVQPIVTIKIWLSGEGNEPVVFQTTPDKLNMIIDVLKSAMKDSEQFGKFLNISN